tara:strand:+ start:2054 stop:2452 length:399 start_codon:yes stop_codon:yes gene_type:complete
MDFHTWLEMPDGTIIDPHFPAYDMIADMRGVSHEKHYHPANQLVQDCIGKTLGDLTWKMIAFFGGVDKVPMRFGFCFLNAFALQQTKYPNAKMVAGSLGFGKKGQTWWEYGDPNWDKFCQFRNGVATQQKAY